MLRRISLVIAGLVPLLALPTAAGRGVQLRRGAELVQQAMPEVTERSPREVPPAAPPAGAAAAASEPPVVVLITLDGVRWQEVFGGVDDDLAEKRGLRRRHEGPERLVPHLHRLATRDGAAIGASAPGMVASGPMYKSLPGYLEIFTGRPFPRCLSNDCGFRRERTIVDEFAAGGGVGDTLVIASWPTLARAAVTDRERVVVSAGRTSGAHVGYLREELGLERTWFAGWRSSSYPGTGDYRSDEHTAALALEALTAHPPRLLVLGLGDSDEFGHAGLYSGYLRALHQADAVVGLVDAALARLRAQGRRATLLVTTDHGRDEQARDHALEQSSARVWLIAAGSGVTARGRVPSPRTRTLSDVAPTLRALGDLPVREHASGSVLDELFEQSDDRTLSVR